MTEKPKGQFPNPETQFKPGQSGNPAGKPKGTRDRSTFLRMLAEAIVRDDSGKTQLVPFGDDVGRPMTAEEIADAAVLLKAMKGNVPAYHVFKDSLHGKIKDVIEVIPQDITKADVDAMTDEEAQAAYDRTAKN